MSTYRVCQGKSGTLSRFLTGLKVLGIGSIDCIILYILTWSATILYARGEGGLNDLDEALCIQVVSGLFSYKNINNLE